MFSRGTLGLFQVMSQNDNVSAFSGCRQDLFEVMMLPETLNALSRGTEVTEIHKYLRASKDKKGS